ncbi:cation-translocating P-type ATPase [Actinocorallia populi]|uniref:cation-translocating P-type ATPase n=1 Tax=Actinocorallia populi TaxID=2079200 RepID=UPI001E5C5602|nr:cation-transporting P-type ATPase [Actinocorallia populi]
MSGGDGAVRAAVRGLTTAEAAERLERDGPNALPQRPPTPLWRRVATQLRDPLIVVLLVAAVLTLLTGDYTDTAVILLVVIANTAVGVWQEVRADRAITALSELTAPAARVVRDGGQREVPGDEVVVGDLVVLGEGDIVPADGVLVEAAGLLVDESSLTGESVPVDKTASASPEDEKADTSRVASGTVVSKGRGQALVTATGEKSSAGRIAAMLGREVGLTPLQRRLAGVGRLLAVLAVVLCVVVLVLGVVRGQPLELMVVTAISLVVAAVPESLPAVVTLALALGARRMAARNALIRKLPAVETLGSVTVLATDKTGTLTEGRMVARYAWTPGGAEAELTGTGYAPEGDVLLDGNPIGPGDRPEVTGLLTAAALCNDARLAPPDGDRADWAALGDPTEAALLVAAARLGLDHDGLGEEFPRTAELPFDSDRKRMTTVHRLPDGRYRVVCKGAPEVLLDSGFLTDGPDVVERAAAKADEYARGGLRVLAVTEAEREDDAPGEHLERGLRLLGLVAILDPPREAAARTIAACRGAGIRPVLITGDHPGTARAIASELGIAEEADQVVDCRGPRPENLREVTVFARADPRHKLDIIEALSDGGEIVAMTGDGVNDGPALRRSDIGVAMGGRGTEVARQAADLVLADDELGTVVAAVEEGRRVYSNIRRFLVYALSGGVTEIAVMLLGPFAGLALPLLPAQILWINLLTHGLPGVALGGEPAEESVMRRPPRPPEQSILGAGLWQRIVRIAVVLTAVTLGVALWAEHTGRPWQTMAFFTLGALQLGAALGSRARPRSLANPMLLAAVAGALLLQLAGVYLPPLRELLGTEPLALTDLLLVCALSVPGYAAVRLDRVLHPGPAARAARRRDPRG